MITGIVSIYSTARYRAIVFEGITCAYLLRDILFSQGLYPAHLTGAPNTTFLLAPIKSRIEKPACGDAGFPLSAVPLSLQHECVYSRCACEH